MAGVILENVSRIYPPGVAAVAGIDLSIRDREFLVLVGPSGCGKTTTLRLIAGLEALSSGKITIGSRVVNDVPPKDRDVAMVFQSHALYPHLTVRGNLAFGSELREGLGVWSRWRARLTGDKACWDERRQAVDRRVGQAASTLGIDGLLERYPRQLSGGQRQRVAVGRAIVRQAAAYLFDEPLSNLDAQLRVELRRELKQLHRRLEATMVYVTHDQVEALTLGERIVVMNEGRILQVGTPAEVYDWPIDRFVAGFIGAPAMNFVAGELDCSGDRPRFRCGGWSTALDKRPIHPGALRTRPAVLGVRPEDVRLVRSVAGSGGQTATVRSVEMLGDASIVTVAVDGTSESGRLGTESHQNESASVVTRLAARSDLQPGERVSVEVDASRVHLFDPDSGQNWIRVTKTDD